jgi:hypothetical protein
LDEVDLSSGFDCLVFRGSDALLHKRMRTGGRQRGIFRRKIWCSGAGEEMAVVHWLAPCELRLRVSVLT